MFFPRSWWNLLESSPKVLSSKKKSLLWDTVLIHVLNGSKSEFCALLKYHWPAVCMHQRSFMEKSKAGYPKAFSPWSLSFSFPAASSLRESRHLEMQRLNHGHACSRIIIETWCGQILQLLLESVYRKRETAKKKQLNLRTMCAKVMISLRIKKVFQLFCCCFQTLVFIYIYSYLYGLPVYLLSLWAAATMQCASLSSWQIAPIGDNKLCCILFHISCMQAETSHEKKNYSGVCCLIKLQIIMVFPVFFVFLFAVNLQQSLWRSHYYLHKFIL